jgi:nitrogen fixation protein NifZ
MTETNTARYAWGQRVQAAADLFNDGSYPEQPTDALLIPGGETGEVVQIGKHTDSGTFVYMVEFAQSRVVGCLEQELLPFVSNGGAL